MSYNPGGKEIFFNRISPNVEEIEFKDRIEYLEELEGWEIGTKNVFLKSYGSIVCYYLRISHGQDWTQDKLYIARDYWNGTTSPTTEKHISRFLQAYRIERGNAEYISKEELTKVFFFGECGG